MGQQQLLLLVLGIVIVGLATVVGIDAYGENSTKANWDALLQDSMRIASDGQSWKQKPELFSGSPDATKGDLDDYSGVDFLQLGFSGSSVTGSGTCYQNLNGTYKLTATTSGLTIEGVSLTNENKVTLEVNGTLSDNIVLQKSSGESVRGGTDLSDGSQATVAAPTCS